MALPSLTGGAVGWHGTGLTMSSSLSKGGDSRGYKQFVSQLRGVCKRQGGIKILSGKNTEFSYFILEKIGYIVTLSSVERRGGVIAE